MVSYVRSAERKQTQCTGRRSTQPPSNVRAGVLQILATVRVGIPHMCEVHSALKLEKSAISKVQKALFAFSKMAKNQFLHQKKV